MKDVNAQNMAAQRLVVLTSVVLFIGKIIAWQITGSVSVLSDALESIVNVLSGFFGLYSIYLSSLPRDSNHPYGHGKVEFISAGFEGTLITIAGGIIIYESVANFGNTIHPHGYGAGIWIVAASALINYIVGAIALKKGKQNHSLALTASGKHLHTDTISTLAILAGLIVISFTGWTWLDSVIAITFSLYIIYSGFAIVRQSLAGIMDESDEKLLNELVAFLEENRSENWVDLHNLRIIKYGAILHMDCHLTVPWYFNVHEAHNEIDKLQALLTNRFGERVELFVHTDGCLDFSCAICEKSGCPQRLQPFTQKMNWTVKNISSNLKHRI
ncbi:MAG: cation diffusion facilitator family transporter [Bacteroidia bacterium]|jgi:cation diffusion facilitator family transporter